MLCVCAYASCFVARTVRLIRVLLLQVQLHAWLLTQTDPAATRQAVTIVMFHGNGGNIGHRLDWMARALVEFKCNVLAIDYRGYGNSSGGPPSEAGITIDAQATLDWLWQRDDIHKGKVFLHGQLRSSASFFFFMRQCL